MTKKSKLTPEQQAKKQKALDKMTREDLLTIIQAYEEHIEDLEHKKSKQEKI